MKAESSIPSFLSCLAPENCSFYLKFPLLSEDISILEKNSFPFLLISDTDPFSRLIEAEVLTNAGSSLRKVFLLVQKDQYTLIKDEFWPINNKDVDNFWQKALSFYAEKNTGSSLIVLANQINKKGQLMPLPSLFFCKAKQLFFNPPCPKCGLTLQQCEDDDLLNNSKLQPYSISLKRYLFCPSCVSSGNYDFYVYELDHFDPPTLKDRWALIKEFGTMRKGIGLICQFPCDKCPNHQECHGPDNLAFSRIVPFSFYPFHILIFEAMSLNAMDYLALVSGASFKEIKSRLETRGEIGRINCLKDDTDKDSAMTLFLYDGDERHFLEVLYLKLTFLGEVLQDLISETTLFKHPDMRLSIDRIWVKIADNSSLLPICWNFKVKFIDISRPLFENQPFKKMLSSSSLYFLALVWFYTLLVNKKQDISRISLDLNKAADNSFSESDFSIEKLLHERSIPTFLPVNIFWDPEGKKTNSTWNHLWERTLLMGWSLLKDSFQNNAALPGEGFLQRLHELRGDIKEELFKMAPIDSRQVNIAENETINHILISIMSKWRACVESEVKSEVKEEKEELTGTVIIPPEGIKRKTPLSPAPSVEEHPPKDDFLAKTVILGPQKTDDKNKKEING